MQSFLFYAQRIAGIRYQKIVVNEAVLLNDDTIMEIEKEASVDSILSKDSSQTLTEKEGLSNKAVQPLANEKKIVVQYWIKKSYWKIMPFFT